MSWRDRAYVLMTLSFGVGILNAIVDFAAGDIDSGLISLSAACFMGGVTVISLINDIFKELVARD